MSRISPHSSPVQKSKKISNVPTNAVECKRITGCPFQSTMMAEWYNGGMSITSSCRRIWNCGPWLHVVVPAKNRFEGPENSNQQIGTHNVYQRNEESRGSKSGSMKQVPKHPPSLFFFTESQDNNLTACLSQSLPGKFVAAVPRQRRRSAGCWGKGGCRRFCGVRLKRHKRSGAWANHRRRGFQGVF